jgi:hypothetical protein
VNDRVVGTQENLFYLIGKNDKDKIYVTYMHVWGYTEIVLLSEI